MKRYQDVFSLAPAQTIDDSFTMVCFLSKKAKTWLITARLIPQMAHTDELGGFQLLEIRSSLPDELPHVRGQALHGP